MNYTRSPFGPVAIIPAAALRNNRTLLRQLEHSSTQRSEDIPINLSYYLAPPRRAESTPPSPFVPSNSFPTPSPTGMSSPYSPYWANGDSRLYRTRSYTTTSIFNEPIRGVPSYVKAVSGPVKYPEPLYRKRAYIRSRSADCPGSGPYEGWPPAPSAGRPLAIATDSPVRMLGRRAYQYPASYVTYPPSTFYGVTGKEARKNNIGVRLALKIAQLLVGAVVIGTVAGPAHGESFASFAARTRSAGQIYVLVIACICLIITAALLVTAYLAKKSQIWRNVDGVFNASAAFLYLVAGCVESWYANCYPPYGHAYPEACKLVAWAIAAILAFVNLVLYTVDFVMSAQAGIDFSL